MKRVSLSSSFLTDPFVLVLSMAILFTGCGMDRLPFPKRRISQLETRMTKQEVQRLLGKPTYDGGDTWTFASEGAWSIFYVYFDGQNRLTSYELDR